MFCVLCLIKLASDWGCAPPPRLEWHGSASPTIIRITTSCPFFQKCKLIYNKIKIFKYKSRLGKDLFFKLSKNSEPLTFIIFREIVKVKFLLTVVAINADQVAVLWQSSKDQDGNFVHEVTFLAVNIIFILFTVEIWIAEMFEYFLKNDNSCFPDNFK